MTFRRLFLCTAFLCLVACGGGGGGGGGRSNNNNNNGSGDTVAPTLELFFPPPGQTYLSHSDSIDLRGTSGDNVGVTEIRGNDLFLSFATSTWDAAAALAPGLNALSITALDDAGNRSRPAAVSVKNDGVFRFYPSSLMYDGVRNRLLLVDASLYGIVEQDLSSKYRKPISFNNNPLILIRGFSVYRPDLRLILVAT